MAKPSMFSKDYDKKMRKRKRRKGFFIVLLIILLVSIPIVVFSNKELINMEKYMSKNEKEQDSNYKKTVEEKKEIDEEKKEEAVNNNIGNKKDIEKEKIEEKIIKISEKENISIFLEYKDDKKKIKDIKGNENIEYDIDDNGNSAILYNKSNQSITLMDRDLNLKDITRHEYVSTFNEAFPKESVMKNNMGYIWQKSPRFIDENRIVYLSELPWINEENNLYVWIYNIKDNTHMMISDNRLVGKNIQFEEKNKEGIKVKNDDKEYLIDSLGQIK